jgi:hypothetical protein
VAEDVIRIFYDHLRAIGKVDQIDLFLYSRGGDTMVPWPLVNLIREYCEKFAVLVPFRAHSAATQIALGANEIVMTSVGELTPVDPTITTPLNPTNPQIPNTPIGIGSEDVSAYLDFLKEQLELSGPSKAEGFLRVVGSQPGQLHPLAVGHVFRIQRLVNEIAEKLLAMHMTGETAERRKQIVQTLVTELRAHEHRIGRAEARRIGLPVVEATESLADTMWDLFGEYENDMQLRIPISAATSFQPNEAVAVLADCNTVYIESTTRTDVFKTDVVLSRFPMQISPQLGQPPRPIWGPQLNVAVENSRWTTE